MCLQIWKELFFMWNSNIRKPEMATCYGMVSEASSDTKPGLSQLNFQGSRSLTLRNSLPQIYVTVSYEIKIMNISDREPAQSNIFLQVILALGYKQCTPAHRVFVCPILHKEKSEGFCAVCSTFLLWRCLSVC